MANKVKILDGQGTQVFPITHVSAVIDNNGNSVEQVLGAQTDLIHQAQLEIGAVPSDLTPTENSSNWVTSDGIFKALNKIVETDVFTNSDEVTWSTGNVYNGSVVSSYANKYKIIDLPSYTYFTVEKGTSSFHLTLLKYNNGTWVTVGEVSSGTTYTCTTTGIEKILLVLWDKPTDAQAQAVDITVTTTNIVQLVRDIDNAPTEGSDNLVTSGGVFKQFKGSVHTKKVDYSSCPALDCFINQDNHWTQISPYDCSIIPVKPQEILRFVRGTNDIDIAVLKTDSHTINTTPTFSSSFPSRIIALNLPEQITIPADANYLYVRRTNSSGTCDTQIISETTNIADIVGDIEVELNGLIPKLSWENRYINTQTGATGEINNRLCSNPILTKGRWRVAVNEGYAIHSIIYYDKNGTFSKGVIQGTQTAVSEEVTDISYLRFIVRKEDVNADISVDEDFGFTIVEAGSAMVDELVVPTFNSSYNQQDTESVREAIGSIINGKNNIETFMFFTDPHLTPYSRYETMTEFVRDKFISTLQKYYNSLPLDYCICGGDWLNFYHSNAEAAGWLGYCDGYMRKLFRNYLPVFGNHDNNPYTDGNVMTDWLKSLTYVDVRNLMFRENKMTYYSYEAVNTRFYVLNSGVSFIKEMTNNTYSRLVSNRWPQVDWLGQKLLSEDPEHSVLVFHLYSNAHNESEWFSTATGYRAIGIHAFGLNVKAMAIAYNKRQSITLNGNTYDFSNCEGNVAFILCGHTHWDYVDSSGELPIVCCTNLEGGYLDNGEVKYTLEPTFDNCVIDYDNSTLYMVRVGAAKSRIVHFASESLQVGGSIELTAELTGTVTWESRDTAKATVSAGNVSGVASGTVGIKAFNDTTEEYWIVNVS